MSFTLIPQAIAANADLKGSVGSKFKLTVTQPSGGSLRLVAATYGTPQSKVTQNGPVVEFDVVSGTHSLSLELAFVTEGETGFLTEIDAAGTHKNLLPIITRTGGLTREYFVEGA